jgi:hypothetical protein
MWQQRRSEKRKSEMEAKLKEKLRSTFFREEVSCLNVQTEVVQRRSSIEWSFYSVNETFSVENENENKIESEREERGKAQLE